MSEYIIGVNILESLTSGMYQDSRIIFREYIQNACDSIDNAVKMGLLKDGEGEIHIEIDSSARNIIISDNGTGIRAEDFVRVMGSIADSAKSQSENKGFRGIGKLCGLAYCRTARFSAKYRGERVISHMTCEAGTLREFFGDRDSGIKRYTAAEVLDIINDFSSEETEDVDAHYFCVELDGINEENKDLPDPVKVKEYLSFAAPLPYYVGFVPFMTKIHEHARKLGQTIDEYNIYLNGDQLFKMYTRTYLIGRGKNNDEIFDLRFEDFRDINNNLVAWMWIGLSHFKGAIDEKCQMRGIRMRKENIQIGDGDTLRNFFSEPRGIHYFVGEIFCVSKDLIPNARRDYFNENPQRAAFEQQLRMRFKPLTKLYHDGSVISSSFRKINEAEQKKADFEEKINSGCFADEQAEMTAREELQTAEQEAQKAVEDIDKLRSSGSPYTVKVIENIEKNAHEATPSTPKIDVEDTKNIVPSTNKRTLKEQKLLRQIFDIIEAELQQAEAQKLIAKIQDRLK